MLEQDCIKIRTDTHEGLNFKDLHAKKNNDEDKANADRDVVCLCTPKEQVEPFVSCILDHSEIEAD